ncbi:MAG: hypothetical protein CFH19_00798 [Alphaproteobacteria bacterium MarineAlpha5_Bin9]|nr:MAG: hypothetical protein CFH19_00798 [Alphaproteobacteria bacterium MarineAlpha5_Bin9]|tara:strand:- start:26881 stop:27231 length:351 start_codon:yes stop_codon:yes gene_type:complete
MSFETFLYTFFCGRFVGKDSFGNKYYCNSKDFCSEVAKRWVIYKGEIEASKVPPHWHAWLHKTINEPPIDYTHKYNWQKEHLPNMTGTNKAIFPDSHPRSNSKKAKIDKEYERWIP